MALIGISLFSCTPVKKTLISSEIPEYEEIIRFSSHSSIKHLKISHFNQDQDIDLSTFTSLEDLYVTSCNDFRWLRSVPSTLKSLTIENSAGKKFRCSDLLGKDIKNLSFQECNNLELKGPLPNNLEVLSISICDSVTLNSDFSSLKKLKTLELSNNNFTNNLHLELSNCSELKNFMLRSCMNVDNKINLPLSIEKIEILGNGMFPFHLDLSKYKNLESVSVSQEVISMELGEYSNLKSLQVCGGKNFRLSGNAPYLEYADFARVSFDKKSLYNLGVSPSLIINKDDCEFNE